ncbi:MULTISPECIES: ParB/RepB/Spo0J family partition protein [Idiomarina]|jgi:ParB family chromosome partitioning protein|uniref:Probable chromosome-partitioning protein ParB n=2 Tax=Idiomarina TaxID=135575 RepID=A0A837NAU6_9GAMM|nr:MULTISPECIES: ParB/RepB/Spo0J family partition protein [Idiomarina]KTG28724.1 chromosome partitioning protein ParB [Idiomarina sp. H105]MCH2455353.1 ParB/RepB/Spo0J family partition protein [Idiomarina sp.]OAF09489.1 chromosome partitioning protein ParB [Idiomarina sp. WRN-38]KPD21556.1 chromosome partitioning protein ParB [Idiomarina zobellii]RUO64388.1 chromosome partitioning protein ParB [Idiomarina piscisalsi]|tara:strand:- start:5376 stop:6254 length:879 start_codon:yes stop_codon:yes gene_type:complete
MSAKKRGLGRGLDALLTSNQQNSERQSSEQVSEEAKGELQKLPIEQLKPGRYQPRKDMSPEALEDLAASVKAQGIIQPIVVRPTAKDEYEIIAGERRWRAAQLAKLDMVPCLVKEVPDEAAVAIALIENIQREDLNAMEEATALQRLLDEFQMTHQDVAQAVGKSRTTVTNLLRLNNLEDGVKVLLERGDIELGHAKLLLALQGEQQADVAQQIVAKDMTVRDAEKLVRRTIDPPKQPEKPEPDANIEHLETKLSETLGAKVQINHGRKGKGKLVINYTSLDELDGILTHIK